MIAIERYISEIEKRICKYTDVYKTALQGSPNSELPTAFHENLIIKYSLNDNNSLSSISIYISPNALTENYFFDENGKLKNASFIGSLNKKTGQFEGLVLEEYLKNQIKEGLKSIQIGDTSCDFEADMQITGSDFKGTYRGKVLNGYNARRNIKKINNDIHEKYFISVRSPYLSQTKDFSLFISSYSYENILNDIKNPLSLPDVRHEKFIIDSIRKVTMQTIERDMEKKAREMYNKCSQKPLNHYLKIVKQEFLPIKEDYQI